MLVIEHRNVVFPVIAGIVGISFRWRNLLQVAIIISERNINHNRRIKKNHLRQATIISAKKMTRNSSNPSVIQRRNCIYL